MIIRAHLRLAKTEAGVMSVNFVRRDVNKYLAYLVEQFSSEALRRKIDLEFVSAGEPLEMDLDTENLKAQHIFLMLLKQHNLVLFK